MNYPIKTDEVNSSLEFFDEVAPLIKEARKYLANYNWYGEIHQGWLFTNIGYALCIFLYRIDNLQNSEDNLVWIIVGDLPPMCLDTYNVLSTKEVVENYTDLVEDWIKKAESGKSLEGCFPLDANVSDDSIIMLKRRVWMLRNNILSNIDDIKYETALATE